MPKNESYCSDINDGLNVDPNKVMTKSFDIRSDKSVKYAFVPNWGQSDHQIVSMIFEDKSNEMFQMSDDCDFNSTNPSLLIKPVAYPSCLSAPELSTLSLQAVVAQYSTYDEKAGRSGGHGMVLFFGTENDIKYCYSESNHLSDYVFKEFLKLFISILFIKSYI